MSEIMCSADGCGRSTHARGLCDPHYRKLLASGTVQRVPRSRPTEDRFWEKVHFTGFCWLWTARIGPGYGRFWNGERDVQAHRWSYEFLVGPILDEMELDHLCRIRACVNPDHLDPVLATINVQRAANAWGAQRHCRRGHGRSRTITKKDGTKKCLDCDQERYQRYRERCNRTLECHLCEFVTDEYNLTRHVRRAHNLALSASEVRGLARAAAITDTEEGA